MSEIGHFIDNVRTADTSGRSQPDYDPATGVAESLVVLAFAEEVERADRLAEAGLPAGVFNVVQGNKEAVDALLTYPDVKAVSFVGSTPIARYIYETGTALGKRVQTLGGAKNRMVILPDANLDMAANDLMCAA